MIKNFTKAKRLLGTWGHEDNWAEFTVKVTRRGVTVSARDVDDGEKFVVTNVEWNGESLSFDALTPSTGWLIRHKFMPNRGRTVLEETRFRQTLKRRKPTTPRSPRR
jgi:hypothetical protein